MSQPPPPDQGNVVDPNVFAARRARRAEVSEGAALELRLFEAERRLREVAAERDALRTRVERLEHELRGTRQREWSEQRQRLEAQGETAAARELAAGQLAGLRERLATAEAEVAVLAAERDRARAALGRERAEAAAGLEARLAAERAALAEQVAAVEGAVASVRERLGGAVRALRERLAAERSRRVALEAELARRADVEARLRAGLDDLGRELAAVRAGEDARVAQLSARVDAVMATAAGLQGGVAAERGAQDDALLDALETMRTRVDALSARVAEAAADREALETERAARWVAEAELDAERRRGAEDRAARAQAETRLSELEAELAETRAAARPPAAPDPETLASLRQAIDGLRAVTVAPAAAPSVGLDLAAAAARLRAAAPAAEPEAAPAPPAPVAVAAPLPRSPLPARPAIAGSAPWLRDALVALAADEPDLAELLLVALLPAQAGLVKGGVTYDLAITGGATHRVVLDETRARVEDPGGGSADARIAGPLAALIPLAAGGARRRLPGTRIEGRRAVRRLLKARRAPVGLPELAAAGVAPSPGLLLTVLARAVPARWTVDRPLRVDVACAGADRWTVVASGTGPLAIVPGDEAGPAPSTLHVGAGRLPAVLGATAAGGAWIEGDPGPVHTLLSWLDSAQRER